MDRSFSQQTKILFKKLSSNELEIFLGKLVSQGARVVFWKSIPLFYEGKALLYTLKANYTLTLDGPNVYVNLLGEMVCLNFVIDGIDHFVRGKIISQYPDNFRIVFELRQDCYAVEKRKVDRIVAYPDYNAFVYLKYEKSAKGDVIYLGQEDKKNVLAFNEIEKFQKSKLKAIDSSLDFDDEFDVIGLRVENFSSTGISFFVSKIEYESILRPLEGKKFKLVFSFVTETYHLEDVEIVFKVDYINQNFSGVHMYKVSAKFLFHKNLWDKIEDLSVGEKIEYAELLRQFEDFIGNESGI